VARRDSPVQNTRRFVDRPTRIAGIDLAAGDVILLLLGASGQAFGHGPHACPGQEIALTIAEAALAQLGPLPAGLRWRYIPLANGRLPEFFDHHEEQR
jgi:cytochrome P450